MRPCATCAAVLAIGLALIGCGGTSGSSTAQHQTTAAAGGRHRRGAVEVPAPGRIPPILDRNNIYAAGRPGLLSPVVRHDPALVYV
ncbi:MAG: hypothetical protein QOE67_905, partial [Solirubrobacteraceae bacterium]|nr:hypothetical protein [Solirubrobacteraceae bacterium]